MVSFIEYVAKLYSAASFGDDVDVVKTNGGEEIDDEFLPQKPQLQLRTVEVISESFL